MYKWASLFLLITLLAACNRPPATTTPGINVSPVNSNVRVSLTARPGEVPSGSSTVLAIQVEAGEVSTVEVAIKGSRAFVTNIALSEGGSYSFTSPLITQDTIFVVTAKDATGTPVATAETTVLVGTLTTQVQTPETAPTPEATPVPTPEATPTPETTPAEAAPVEPAGTSQEGLPEGAVRVGNLAELQTATSEEATATTIMVAGTITCDADPCVRLKSGQTLMGEGGVGVLMADRTNEGDLTTVIELAPDVSVVSLEISGPDIYTAINGIDSELSGTVFIKDVSITSPSSNAPITVRDSESAGSYTLLIDGLTVAETTKAISFADFEKLELTKSTFNLNISDNSRGIIFQTSTSGTVLLDNVAVSSTLASETFTPLSFTNVGSEGTLGVTLSNTMIVFPTATPEALAVARSIGLESSTGTGKIAIATPTSIGNTTQALSPLTVVYDARDSADPLAVIIGYIQGALGDGTAFAER
jgi:hypothetical protein